MSFIEREEHRRSQFCGMLYCYLNQDLFRSYDAALIVAVARGSWATQHLVAIIIQHLRDIVNLLLGANGEGKVYETLTEDVLFLILNLWPCHQFQPCIGVLKTQNIRLQSCLGIVVHVVWNGIEIVDEELFHPFQVKAI